MTLTTSPVISHNPTVDQRRSSSARCPATSRRTASHGVAPSSRKHRVVDQLRLVASSVGGAAAITHPDHHLDHLKTGFRHRDHLDQRVHHASKRRENHPQRVDPAPRRNRPKTAADQGFPRLVPTARIRSDRLSRRSSRVRVPSLPSGAAASLRRGFRVSGPLVRPHLPRPPRHHVAKRLAAGCQRIQQLALVGGRAGHEMPVRTVVPILRTA